MEQKRSERIRARGKREEKVHRINEYAKKRSSAKYHFFMRAQVELDCRCLPRKKEKSAREYRRHLFFYTSQEEAEGKI
jgi:hypothetical protein